MSSRKTKSCTPRPRHPNKTYRCPRTPSPGFFTERERSFVLDCRASRHIADEVAKLNPKLWTMMPPYNGQADGHTRRYYQFEGVAKTLSRTGQSRPGTSIEGPIMDRYHKASHGETYLQQRNVGGPGHSEESFQGHQAFMTPKRDIIGFNGYFGYRRNTPWLRQRPSPFGVNSNFPLGWPDENKPRLPRITT